jgi:hypothetical protein
MTMRVALKTSSNRAAVRMLREIGIPTAVTFADRMGVGPIPAVPSLVLGSGEVTLMAMAAAFSAFANDGLVPTPSLITHVEDVNGQVLYKAEHSSHRAISETTAFLMSNMLADVINSGTAWSARRVGFTAPAAIDGNAVLTIVESSICMKTPIATSQSKGLPVVDCRMSDSPRAVATSVTVQAIPPCRSRRGDRKGHGAPFL